MIADLSGIDRWCADHLDTPPESVVVTVAGTGATIASVLRQIPAPALELGTSGAALLDGHGLSRAVQAALGDREVDLVIDDGSHDLQASRTVFEVLFPRLREGGRHVLLDWAWSHRPGAPDEQPALTNLVVEIVMLAGTDPQLVRRLTVEEPAVVTERGEREVHGPFHLAGAYRNRGIRYRPVL